MDRRLVRCVLALALALAMVGCDDMFEDGGECMRDINACSPAPAE